MEVGDVLADKYRVERVVGVGGMGVVMAARHTTLDQAVAIKFLSIGGQGGGPSAHDDETAEQFLREARASALIESDHVARVFDVGQLPSGVPYMVMEYLEGVDLDGELSRRGPLPLGEAVDYVLQALDAVAAAHHGGVIHRDLKPANLFLAKRPDGSRRLKVLDFGISKRRSEARSDGAIVGTPSYMSPEQAQDSGEVDHRTDIWAIGAILYELVAGRPPFTGATPEDTLRAVVNEAPVHLSERCPSVPRELEAIIHRCLARDPDERFATAGALAERLVPFASKESLAGLPSVQRELKSGPLALDGGDITRVAHLTPHGWTGGGSDVAGTRRRGWFLALVGIPIAGSLLGVAAFSVHSARRDAASEVPLAPLVAAPPATASLPAEASKDAGLLPAPGATPPAPASASADAPARATEASIHKSSGGAGPPKVRAAARPTAQASAAQTPAKAAGKSGILDTRD